MTRLSLLLLSLAPAAAVFSGVETVTDIIPGTGGAYPSYLTVHAGVLYFRANDTAGAANVELWRFDGTQATRVADISPGVTGSSPSYLTFLGDTLYFGASGCSGCGVRLWQLDGSGVAEAPGAAAGASNPEALVAYQGKLYFRAFRSGLGIELWSFDGATQAPIDIYPGPGSSYPQHFTLFDGKLYFNANGTPGDGSELFVLEGDAVRLAADIHPGDGSSPEHLAVLGDRLYFSARSEEGGRELWRFDGAHAERVTDIVPGPGASNPYGMTAYRDALYFGADDEVHGTELWRWDGIRAELVADINQSPILPGADPIHHASPAAFTVHDDLLYFTADDGIHGRELWSFDGAAVSLVADIYPGEYGSNITELVVYRDALFFNADDGQHGGELGYSLPSLWRLRRAPAPRFVRGDANGDGETDVSDAVAILLLLFGGRPATVPCALSADVDDSDALDLADAVRLLEALFRGGPALLEPSTGCGPDPTPAGTLPCELAPACAD